MGKATDAYKAIDSLKASVSLRAIDEVSGGLGDQIYMWLYQAALNDVAASEPPASARGGMAVPDPLDIPPALRRGSDEGDPD